MEKSHFNTRTFFVLIASSAMLSGCSAGFKPASSSLFQSAQSDSTGTPASAPAQIVPLPAVPAGAGTVALQPSQFGSVFYPSDALQFTANDSSGDQIQWLVSDFSGNPVLSGTSALSQGRALIQPALSDLGYYQLGVVALQAGAPIAQGNLSFAIVSSAPVSTGDNSRFSVQTHFAQGWNTDIVPLISKAGITNNRDEQYWQTIEQQKGVYDFSAFTGYMSALKSAGIDPLICLDWGNSLYETSYGQFTAPYSSSGRQGYDNYIQALLQKYGSQIHNVEIWNEYNGSFCNDPNCSPQSYVQMLQSAYQSIKSTRPDVKVIGGAVVPIALPYLSQEFQAGALSSLDAVDVHPYEDPEQAETDIQSLKNLMNTFGDVKPIWATEVGYSDTSATGRQNVARKMARLFAILISQNVERISWYLLRDYQSFTSMGLLQVDSSTGQYSPAPAYAAYSTLIHQYEGVSFIRREATDDRTRIYLFQRGNQELRAAWTTDQDISISLVTTQPLTITELTGKTYTLAPQNGQIQLTIGADVLYIQSPLGAITQIIEHRADVELADAVADFSDTQGQKGWSYLYYVDDPAQGSYPAGGLKDCT